MPRDERPSFIAGALGVSAAYAMGAIFLALGAQIARDLVRSDNAFVDGAIISLSAVAIGVVAVLARPLRAARRRHGRAAARDRRARPARRRGRDPLAAGLPRSSLVAGAGYSLMFSGGLGLVTSSAPRTTGPRSSRPVRRRLPRAGARRARLGVLATTSGLQLALDVGAPLILLLGVAALAVANARRVPVAVELDTARAMHRSLAEPRRHNGRRGTSDAGRRQGEAEAHRSKRAPAGLGGQERCRTSRMIAADEGDERRGRRSAPDRFVSCRRRQYSASSGTSSREATMTPMSA